MEGKELCVWERKRKTKTDRKIEKERWRTEREAERE